MDQRMAFFGNGFENGGNQVGFGGKGDEFLSTGLNGVYGTIDVISDTTGNNRDIYAFLRYGINKGCDIKGDVGHYNVDTVACPQDIKRSCYAFGQLYRSAARHSDLAGCADLSAQSTNDQYLHSLISFRSFSIGRESRFDKEKFGAESSKVLINQNSSRVLRAAGSS